MAENVIKLRIPLNKPTITFMLSNIMHFVKVWDIILLLQTTHTFGKPVKVMDIENAYKEQYGRYKPLEFRDLRFIGINYGFLSFSRKITCVNGHAFWDSRYLITNKAGYLAFREKLIKNKRIQRYIENKEVEFKIDPLDLKARKQISVLDDDY